MSDRLYIGIGGHVVAVDPATGTELWRTKLKTASFATVWVSGKRVFGGAGGELFCLDPTSGHILWRNRLKGLGMNVVAFASSGDLVAGLSAAQQEAAAAAAH